MDKKQFNWSQSLEEALDNQSGSSNYAPYVMMMMMMMMMTMTTTTIIIIIIIIIIILVENTLHKSHPYHSFLWQSFPYLVHKPLMLNVTVEAENSRLKVCYSSEIGEKIGSMSYRCLCSGIVTFYTIMHLNCFREFFLAENGDLCIHVWQTF